MNDKHFLFNVLSSLVARTQDDDLQEMVLNLADFLRYSFRETRLLEPFGHEMDAIFPYIELQQSLHGENLICKVSSSEEARLVPIPPTMLHTLLKNAFEEGMRTSKMPLQINLSAIVERGEAMSDNREILVVKVGYTGLLALSQSEIEQPEVLVLREQLLNLFAEKASIIIEELTPWVTWTVRIPVDLAKQVLKRVLERVKVQ